MIFDINYLLNENRVFYSPRVGILFYVIFNLIVRKIVKTAVNTDQ